MLLLLPAGQVGTGHWRIQQLDGAAGGGAGSNSCVAPLVSSPAERSNSMWGVEVRQCSLPSTGIRATTQHTRRSRPFVLYRVWHARSHMCLGRQQHCTCRQPFHMQHNPAGHQNGHLPLCKRQLAALRRQPHWNQALVGQQQTHVHPATPFGGGSRMRGCECDPGQPKPRMCRRLLEVAAPEASPACVADCCEAAAPEAPLQQHLQPRRTPAHSAACPPASAACSTEAAP